MSPKDECLWVYRYTAPNGDRAHKTACGWITVAKLTGSFCCYCGKRRVEFDVPSPPETGARG